MLCAFFWVISRRLNFISRRFGTLCLFYLHRQVGIPMICGYAYLPTFIDGQVYLPTPAYEDGTDSVPKRRHIKFRRRGITQKKS